MVSIQSTGGHDSDGEEQNNIETDDANMMYEDDEFLGDYDEVPALMDGAETTGGYTREVPQRFSAERDDRLMNSIIKNYAREVKKDGKLTGQYFCNKEDAQALSSEVIDNHRKHNSNLGEINSFEDTWNHFDVNHDGLVEVERMPQFLRMLLGNALDNDL